MARKLSDPCYYCGGAATSREHAPPKQMFRGFDCDSITAPSCDDHNSKKSGSDQAIVSAFLIPLKNGADRYSLEPEIEFAIKKAASSFKRAKRKAINAPLLSDPPANLMDMPDVAHITPSTNIHGWIRQLTAALVYDATKAHDSSIEWDDVFAWSPDFIGMDEPISLTPSHAFSTLTTQQKIKAEFEGLQWLNGWSARPRPYPSTIYSFDLCIRSEDVVFRHRFYGRYTWYVWICPLPDTLLKLKQKLVIFSQ